MTTTSRTSDQIPLSHSHGPDTSHKAEARYTNSGKLSGDRARVLALHCRYPGRTCEELFERCIQSVGAATLAGIVHWSNGLHLIDEDLRAYAKLRETIKKRTTDLWNLGHLERRKDEAGDYITRGGALCYWPTARGIDENDK